MERRLAYTYVLTATIGALLLGCVLYFVTHCVYCVTKYKIYVDPLVSQVTCDSIVAYIKEMNGVKPDIIFKQVQKQFPFIKSMRARYYADGKLKVSLQCFVPRLKINNEFVLTEHGELAALNSFISSYTERLSSLTICADDQVGSLFTDAILSFAYNLPSNLIDQCDVTMVNSNDVSLQNHKESNFAIRCCANNLPSQELYEQCKKIKNTFLDAGLLCDGDSDYWIADVRFGDQIVLYRQREEVSYG